MMQLEMTNVDQDADSVLLLQKMHLLVPPWSMAG